LLAAAPLYFCSILQAGYRCVFVTLWAGKTMLVNAAADFLKKRVLLVDMQVTCDV